MKISRDTKEFLITTLGGAGFVIATTVVIMSFVYVGNRIACHYRWEGTHPSEYGLFSGCRIQKDGKWFPERTIRNLD